MRKEELEQLIEGLKEEKLKLEKKLPEGFRRTNSIYQYGRICAFIEVTEEQLNELENKNK